MRKSLLLSVASVFGLASLPYTLAWGAAGHEIVATIAQSYLDSRVLNTVCSILASDVEVDQIRGDAPCYLSTVASWADKIRNHARWSGPLHYVGAVGDHPSDNCLFPGSGGWEGRERGNVLDAIQNVSSILVDFARVSTPSSATVIAAPEQAQEALKFLIHFVGDMHQPLHLTGRDRGGNGDKVSWDGRVTNLHSVWDTSLIAKSLRTISRNYSRPLPVPALESSLRGAIYDPYVRRIVWEGVGVGRGTGRWESEANSWLACPGTSHSAHGQEAPQEVLAGAPRRKPVSRGPPQTSDSDILCPHAWAAPITRLTASLCGHQNWTTPNSPHTTCRKDAGRGSRNYLELDTPEYSGRIGKDWVLRSC
ncbi:S1/P1 nuclease-domain-containing protein [Multifurca ochricompacta]|uniref:S1/P1 nuclease-domain-containing protein n=1 Tax=Multifurca ochricompacta TaxID=376703 RepID=A0AAD4M0E2_9AGAM|nr:S1/P1 nuclease-domain-containing protein [Multifurca ochricompacta]